MADPRNAFEDSIKEASQACKKENLAHLAHGSKFAARVYLTLAKKTLDDPSVLERLRWFLELPTEAQQNLLNPQVVVQTPHSVRAIKSMFGKPKKIGIMTVPEEQYHAVKCPIVRFERMHWRDFDRFGLLSEKTALHRPRPSCIFIPGQSYEVYSCEARVQVDLHTAIDFLVRRNYQLPGQQGALMFWEQLKESVGFYMLDVSSELPVKHIVFADHDPCLPRNKQHHSQVPIIKAFTSANELGRERHFDLYDAALALPAGTMFIGLKLVQ